MTILQKKPASIKTSDLERLANTHYIHFLSAPPSPCQQQNYKMSDARMSALYTPHIWGPGAIWSLTKLFDTQHSISASMVASAVAVNGLQQAKDMFWFSQEEILAICEKALWIHVK